MLKSDFDISRLCAPGDYVVADLNDGHAALVVRLTTNSEAIPHSLPVGGEDVVVAFSARCTHLGCSLVNDGAGTLPHLAEIRATLCGCSCHHSSFDLARRGIPVNAPATACLPQLAIEFVDDRDGMVGRINIIEWVRQAGESVPYGVPYGSTADRLEQADG